MAIVGADLRLATDPVVMSASAVQVMNGRLTVAVTLAVVLVPAPAGSRPTPFGWVPAPVETALAAADAAPGLEISLGLMGTSLCRELCDDQNAHRGRPYRVVIRHASSGWVIATAAFTSGRGAG